MTEHFRAYTFVDRITSLGENGLIRGYYDIPAHLDSFPLPLLAEAVGQLAAWAAMSAVDFQTRPVAGIAAAINLPGRGDPGQRLDLQAELQSVDKQAVAYGGTASVNGNTVITLEHCVGPMLPIEEFEDPAAARSRFALLCDDGAEPGLFKGLPELALQRNGGERGKSVQALLDVPTEAPFFADHFPRRPVFPGTLLMHANFQLVRELASEIAPPRDGRSWKVQNVAGVKLRAFIAPGDQLHLNVSLFEQTETGVKMRVKIQKGDKPVGSARVGLAPDS